MGRITNLELVSKDKVLVCPFCGGPPELQNTHTACYWIECQNCEAQVSGEAYGTNVSSQNLSLRQHQLAKNSAIKSWNKRFSGALKTAELSNRA